MKRTNMDETLIEPEIVEHGGAEDEGNDFSRYALVVPPEKESRLPVHISAGLQRYLWEIGQYRLLTKEETDELATRFYETGDQDAAYHLVTSNLRLVIKVAMDFQKYWMQNFLDLVQEGNVGLVQAVKKFDPYRGVKFSYYAAYWIRAYILKFIMDNWRLVKIGTTQAQRKLFFSLNKERKLLESQGFEPETKLLAERLGVKESEVIEMGQRLNYSDVSLEAPIREDSDDNQKNFIPHPDINIDETFAKQEVSERISSALGIFSAGINPKEQAILDERLLVDEPKTLQEIADRFGISRERVRQIEANLLKKLRKFLEQRFPDVRDFLDVFPGRF